MSVKCPACGMESADDAQWCDFCKEPFRKRKESPPPAKTNAADAGRLPPGLLERLPDELRKDADALPVPAVPGWFRPAAYLFVAALAALTLSLVVVTLRRSRGLTARRQAMPESLPGTPFPR